MDGLQYRALSSGAGNSPGMDDQVILNYSAHLLDGTEILDSHRPVRFMINQLAPGLSEALSYMKEGSQWGVYAAPEHAYREESRNRIRYGFEPVVFMVELVAVLGTDNNGQLLR